MSNKVSNSTFTDALVVKLVDTKDVKSCNSTQPLNSCCFIVLLNFDFNQQNNCIQRG